LPRWLAELPDARAVAHLADRLRVADGTRAAAYAAFPHLVALVATDPGPAAVAVATLAARIEIARQRPDPPDMPADLAEGYEAARKALLPTCLRLAGADPAAVPVAAAAVALASGQHILAEAYLELTPTEADAFLLWAKTR
jgi:hypothetical protein